MQLHKWYENSSALSLPSRAHKTTFSRRKVLFIVCVPPFFSYQFDSSFHSLCLSYETKKMFYDTIFKYTGVLNFRKTHICNSYNS